MILTSDDLIFHESLNLHAIARDFNNNFVYIRPMKPQGMLLDPMQAEVMKLAYSYPVPMITCLICSKVIKL